MKILNIGCCGDSNNWKRHKEIKNFNKGCELHGLDINLQKIKKMRKENFIIYNHNLNSSPIIFGKFDIIYAEEIIEHLTNLDNFFKFIKLNLKKDGKLIITTPNCCRLNNCIRAMLNKEQTESQYHTIAFNDFVLKNILQSKGFKNIKIKFSNKDYSKWTNIFQKSLSSNLILTANKMEVIK